MPIKGLTDRGLSFPEIGQIRKGAKKPADGKKPGADLSYFRVEFDEQEAKAAEIFRQTYGNQPAAIRIILPFNEIERMWDANLEGYTAGRMVARSDGEIYNYLVDAQTGELLVKNGIDLKTRQPRPYIEGEPCGSYKAQNGKIEKIFCKPSGRLKVIIPELARAAYLTVLTTSKHDIINISDQLRAFQTINNGIIAGIPLVLRRRPRKISTPNADGTRARRVKWLLSIEADPEWVKRRLTETKRLALPGNGLALPAPERPQLEPGDEGDYEPDAGDLADADYDEGEVEEGEYTMQEEQKPAAQPQNQPPAEQAAQQTNGNGKRPYPPATVKQRMLDYAAKAEKNKWTISDGARNMLAPNLEKLFLGDPAAEDKRHAILNFVFGVTSAKDLSMSQACALSKWMNYQQVDGGDWLPDPHAVEEAKAMATEALKAEGQLEMF